MFFAGVGVILVYLVLLVLQNTNTVTTCKESLAVKTSEGYVIGCRNIALGMTIFYGIPYASAPKGRDKFKVSEKLSSSQYSGCRLHLLGEFVFVSILQYTFKFTTITTYIILSHQKYVM